METAIGVRSNRSKRYATAHVQRLPALAPHWVEGSGTGTVGSRNNTAGTGTAASALHLRHHGRTVDTQAVESIAIEQLAAFENRDVPAADRSSDSAEARADEKQDPTTTSNFRFIGLLRRRVGTTFSNSRLACALLAPRPDDLVLDFAAGTCWATEFLARVGIRTVSIDLSLEMMRRGRARLAADKRLVFRRDAAFVTARGQSLPFANETFDGIFCLNALHHLPSYEAALREMYRVLKPGGARSFL